MAGGVRAVASHSAATLAQLVDASDWPAVGLVRVESECGGLRSVPASISETAADSLRSFLAQSDSAAADKESWRRPRAGWPVGIDAGRAASHTTLPRPEPRIEPSTYRTLCVIGRNDGRSGPRSGAPRYPRAVPSAPKPVLGSVPAYTCALYS